MTAKRYLLSFFSLFSLLVLFITVAVYIKRGAISGDHYGQVDFFKFYESVLFYFSGQSIYSPTIIKITLAKSVKWVTADGNLNPPFLTLLLLPLCFFNFASAFYIWIILSVATIILGGWLALRPFAQWHQYTLPILALFTLYIPNSGTLAYGQITSFMLVILAGAWVLARKNKDRSAGVLIGIACAIKLFCGLFLIYFLCIKRYRLLLSSLVTFLISFIIPLFVFGIKSYVEYHRILTKIGWYVDSWNASFYGFFARIFSNTEENVPPVLFPHVATILTVLCSAGLMGYLVYTWRRCGSVHFDRGFSLTIIAMLLLSPLGWVYYFPLLIIPYFVLISESSDMVHLMACFLLFLSTLVGDMLRTQQVKTLAQVFLMSGFGFYVLIGLLGLFAYAGKRQGASGISEGLWGLIYGLVFIPSAYSLIKIIQHLH